MFNKTDYKAMCTILIGGAIGVTIWAIIAYILTNI